MKQQIEISFANEPFRLVPLSAEDGDRIVRERQQQESDRAESDKHQEKFALAAGANRTKKA